MYLIVVIAVIVVVVLLAVAIIVHIRRKRSPAVARHEIRFNNPSYVGSATASHQFTFGEASFGVTKRAHSPIVSMAHKDIVVAPVMATPTDLGFHVGLLTPLQKSRPGDESIGAGAGQIDERGMDNPSYRPGSIRLNSPTYARPGSEIIEC